jgi:hypothetical protein
MEACIVSERIKELTELAGLDPCVFYDNLLRISDFAELVRQDEREACAKLCESMGVHPALNVWGGGPEWYKRQKECAAAIRARSKHDI